MIWSFLIVTLAAVTLTLYGMDSPLSTAPAPVTLTKPPELEMNFQPVPLETWPGTDFKTVPAGTPVLEALGKLATAAEPTEIAGDSRPPTARATAAAPARPPAPKKTTLFV